MNEIDVENILVDIIQNLDPEDDYLAQIEAVCTFSAVGLLTRDNGIVLRMADGSEFQISIVRSR